MKCKEKLGKKSGFYSASACFGRGLMYTWLLGMFRPKIVYLGKDTKDWMEKGIVKWITTGTNCIPIDRFGLDTAWLRETVTSIKAGNDVIIFISCQTCHRQGL